MTSHVPDLDEIPPGSSLTTRQFYVLLAVKQLNDKRGGAVTEERITEQYDASTW
jgi:hypothetical protein